MLLEWVLSLDYLGALHTGHVRLDHRANGHVDQALAVRVDRQEVGNGVLTGLGCGHHIRLKTIQINASLCLDSEFLAV